MAEIEENQTSERKTYNRFTVQMAINIAAPHTWPAAIMPCLIAVAAAITNGYHISVVMAFDLLAISILMQAAVNTFNDYYDCIKGTDSKEDDVDPSDAVLIYNNVNPKSALRLAIGFLVVAFIIGAYVVFMAGIIPLIIAIIGAFFVVVYSAGKTPISYLPVGEIVSGVVMGGLITLASYQALTLDFTFLALVWALPTIIGVGLIMFTNNTCDIERDTETGRHTLPVTLGREKARNLYHGCLYAMIIAIGVITGCFFTSGLIVMPFLLLASYPIVKALVMNPLDSTHRIQAMSQVLSVNIVLEAFYIACILAGNHAFFM